MTTNIEQCLQNFVQHVNNLLVEEDPAGNGFHREFRALREIQIENKRNELYPTEEGQKDENIKKNRYKDILPRDDRRVVLSTIDEEEDSSYINATFILGMDGRNSYIAAQGPMLNTVNDFWRMLWEQKAEIVFMACRLVESGKPKCEKYWPDVGKEEHFGDIIVHTESEETIQEEFVMRKLNATKSGVSHYMTQFHYMGWPDHGTPASPKTLRDMIQTMRSHRKKKDIPIVIHCSAGCGRTGTICAIDYAWSLLELGQINRGFSMFDIIKSLRDQRVSMVQTPDQYEYIHTVMKSLFEEWLDESAKPDYTNISINENYVNVDTQPDSSDPEDGHIEVAAAVTACISGAQPTPNLDAGIYFEVEADRNPIGDEVGLYVDVMPSEDIVQGTQSVTSLPICLKDKISLEKNKEKLGQHRTIITFGTTDSRLLPVKTGDVMTNSTRKEIPADMDAPAVPARCYSLDDLKTSLPAVPNQTSETASDECGWMQRLLPVRGPRPMPQQWNLQSKSTTIQGTYL